ncbi:hypothetical protein MMC17_005949 [Xylographa soralifera]|nr:hypothetical protein [Xylographa soralifera]
MSGNDLAQHVTQSTIHANEQLVGQSGRHYLIERVLQSKEVPPSHVYLTTCEKQSFVVKTVLAEFQYYHDMQRALSPSRYLRLLQDTIPNRSMFVYKYLNDHLLSLAQKNLPLPLTKRILKDALHGIAELQSQNIVHTDIKPNNIFVQWSQTCDRIIIDDVRLGDLEDSAYVPPGSNVRGRQVGNQNWRSPEAHAEGRVNKPSDMFSFGIVCIYAVLKHVILYVAEEALPEGEVALAHVLERRISYFADLESLDGLLRHLGDSPWCQVLEVLRDGFDKENPREPFVRWNTEPLDSDFKDLYRRPDKL